MSAADLACGDARRRQLIRDRKLNGVDYVDVAGPHLCVHFLTGIPPEFLSKRKGSALTPEEKAAAIAHIAIRGGRRVTGIRVVDIDPEAAPSKYEESCLDIVLDREGDWSTYTLCFVETEDGQPSDAPLRSLDRRYACLDFTFKIDCPAEIDCASDPACPVEERPAPVISYLAKDYATFRQLVLDRLALTMTQWRERHVPDIGIALIEVLAYVADYLSYFQDSVATEQYLDTARQRISVRRHARLVDYLMHEGCNARVFISLRVARDEDKLDPRQLYFVTGASTGAAALRQSDLDVLPAGWVAFEPLTARKTLKLRLHHNAIRIYTWGEEECCLPKGATRATLLDEIEERDEYDPAICDERPVPPPDPEYQDKRGYRQEPRPDPEYHDKRGYRQEPPPDPEYQDKRGYRQEPPPKPPMPRPLDLEPGDFLLLEELACAGTVFNTTERGDGGFDSKNPVPQPDADRTHRHVVRLTRVEKCCDPLRGNRVLEVEWCREDALPFPLCVSAIGAAPKCDLVRGLAIARGNVILADHGATVRDEALPTVEPQQTTDVCEGEDAPADVARLPARFRPRLQHGPLTFAQPLDADACALAAVRQNPRAALAAVSLAAIPPTTVKVATKPDWFADVPLFTPAAFADLPRFAESLKKLQGDPRLLALRGRLRSDVIKMLEGDVTEKLLTALAANLRALTEGWEPRADLLDSGSDDANFVAEIDDSGTAHLRFGNNDFGRGVDVGMAFLATYRVGNGRAGLVGPESIAHVVFRSGFSDVITGVRNPLPSVGAAEPEPVSEVKMFAPGAFRKELGRAVIDEDYAALAQYVRYPERDPRVQAASAALRWSGSWYEADVALDALGTPDLDSSLQASVEQRLRRYRRMGHDLRVGAADIVPIRLKLDLCIKPDYLRAHVVAAVREALSNRTLSGGHRGFFHPDNLTFGTAVYVSRIVAAVMALDGVAEVHVVRLERLSREKASLDQIGAMIFGETGNNPDLPKGLLRLKPNEIARLDNDPAIPENGILSFRQVRGGR
jgi:hypothetical protein